MDMISNIETSINLMSSRAQLILKHSESKVLDVELIRGAASDILADCRDLYLTVAASQKNDIKIKITSEELTQVIEKSAQIHNLAFHAPEQNKSFELNLPLSDLIMCVNKVLDEAKQEGATSLELDFEHNNEKLIISVLDNRKNGRGKVSYSPTSQVMIESKALIGGIKTLLKLKVY